MSEPRGRRGQREPRPTPIEAARLAASLEIPPLSEHATRIVLAAAVLWCRHLQLPSVRSIARECRRAPSAVLAPFGRAIDIHATVIALEWRRLDQAMLGSPDESQAWLDEHALELAALDPDLIRLPELVTAAVDAAFGPEPVRPGEPVVITAPLSSRDEASGSWDDLERDANGCPVERKLLGDIEVEIHYDDLPPTDWTVVDGIRCTTPLRTVLDLAAQVEAEHLEAMLDDCLRRGLFTIEDARMRMAAPDVASRPGTQRLAALLDRR